MSTKPSSANGSTGSSWATLDLSALVRELPLETLRMVDLARAVARDPHVLLLDEITAALSADQAERVFALLRRWKERGRSAVLITHRLAEVMRVCDRATILRDGENVALHRDGRCQRASVGRGHARRTGGGHRPRRGRRGTRVRRRRL